MSQELEERALEYQKNFSYENFRVIRKELFAHMRDPSLTIRPDGVTFNAACINKLEGVVYIKMLLDDVAKQLAIKQCSPDERHALRWCIQKEDGTRKSRKMKGEDFADMVYDLMGWDKTKRYKIIGFLIEVSGVPLFVFDLNLTESFDATRRKKKTMEEATERDVEGEEGKVEKKVEEKPLARFSEKIRTTFGDTIEEDEARQHWEMSNFLEV